MQLGTIAVALAGLAVAGGAAGLIVTAPAEFPASALAAYTANAGNGATMFNIGGCASCHATPGQDNHLRLGGGLELKTAFGTFRVPNISADAKAGIGGWTEPQFVTAMLKGTGRNGEHLYPAFPYSSYQRMRVADVRDLFAHLKTLPADPAPSRPHELSFPFNQRIALGGWKLLFLDGKPFAPDAGRDAQFNRGAYLVEGPGHCAECHSRRNLLGGITSNGRFVGGPNPEGKGYIPNITPHADGLAKWSAKDVEYMLETGFTPDGGTVSSSMAEVIENTKRLTGEDRRAMAAYIKALAPGEGRLPATK